MDVDKIIREKKNRRLSDDEIIKTLICCNECNCKECPKYISELGRCMGNLDSAEILGLIQRQQTLIEELTEKVCVLREELEIGINEHLMTIHDLKKKNEELSNKHWGECRQIAHYSQEVKR